MSRFEIVDAVIEQEDGITEIIKDQATFRFAETFFGSIRVGTGYVRCTGKQYLGTYGRETPIFVGTDSDVYYATVSYCDGGWWKVGPNRRGLHNYVTAGSGTGKLFAELEAFVASQATVR